MRLPRLAVVVPLLSLTLVSVLAQVGGAQQGERSAPGQLIIPTPRAMYPSRYPDLNLYAYRSLPHSYAWYARRYPNIYGTYPPVYSGYPSLYGYPYYWGPYAPSPYAPGPYPAPMPGAAVEQLPNVVNAAGAEDAPQVPSDRAYVQVIVPEAGAEIWFAGDVTTTRGTTRMFQSPVLQPGRVYYYTIRAAWSYRGVPVEEERRVAVRPGQVTTVDFTRPTPPM